MTVWGTENVDCDVETCRSFTVDGGEGIACVSADVIGGMTYVALAYDLSG